MKLDIRDIMLDIVFCLCSSIDNFTRQYLERISMTLARLENVTKRQDICEINITIIILYSSLSCYAVINVVTRFLFTSHFFLLNLFLLVRLVLILYHLNYIYHTQVNFF